MHNLLLQKQARTCCSTGLRSPLAAEQSSTREEKRVQCSHTHWRQLELCRDKPRKTGHCLHYPPCTCPPQYHIQQLRSQISPQDLGASKLIAHWVKVMAGSHAAHLSSEVFRSFSARPLGGMSTLLYASQSAVKKPKKELVGLRKLKWGLPCSLEASPVRNAFPLRATNCAVSRIVSKSSACIPSGVGTWTGTPYHAQAFMDILVVELPIACHKHNWELVASAKMDAFVAEAPAQMQAAAQVP